MSKHLMMKEKENPQTTLQVLKKYLSENCHYRVDAFEFFGSFMNL